MNLYIETFGCTFNQADSQIIVGLLEDEGMNMVDKPEDAEVLIINTCYVKKPTEQRVINRINTFKKDFPHKNLIITGCMVEIDPDKLNKIAPHAGWIGPHKIKNIPPAVKSSINGDPIRLTGPEKINKVSLPKSRFNPLIEIIQICEGCNEACSYCCTRIARGSLFSYPVELIKQEVEKAVKEGCVEIQLTAQDTAAYGKDTGDSLPKLINSITSIDGDFRVRVGMMHPRSIIRNVEELIKSFKSEKIYKFLHIPLQSGNDDVLDDMKRGHNIMEFKEVITRFRAEIPDISLATDIIVGYPTEDELAFEDTLNIIREVKPDFLHISKYHHRPGASSTTLNEISHQDMKKRSKMLNEVKSNISYNKNQDKMDKILKVLITGKGIKGGFLGRTDTYKTVIVEKAPLGSIVDVEITEAKGTYLKGEIVSY
ncbi:MAG: tRNA (N(6)-L-threonylcarbamoyladenosine(37)-C(2))-methylthiotransferase [Methanobacterium sp.]|nr:tRNA (N(6)-L-threonylcarbamoyladenosine(37)-C(2))-methylthiotransferase [Methanobacterium sp.]